MSTERRNSELNHKYWKKFKSADRSVEECKYLCSADPACLSFEYGVAYGGSNAIYQPRDCMLRFEGLSATGCSGTDYNLDLYVKLTEEGKLIYSGLSKLLCNSNY